jgi:hypothetical protein
VQRNAASVKIRINKSLNNCRIALSLSEKIEEENKMKKFITLLIAAIFVVSGFAPDVSAQQKKKRKVTSNASRNRANIGSGTALGAGVGGRSRVKGAIGAGGAGTYLYTRSGRRYYRGKNGKVFYRTIKRGK